MIVWAKKTFWINRSTQEILIEFSLMDRPVNYMGFVKDCHYELFQYTAHGVVSDYIHQMLISNENLDLLFYSDKVHNAIKTAKMRDDKITEIFNN